MVRATDFGRTIAQIAFTSEDRVREVIHNFNADKKLLIQDRTREGQRVEKILEHIDRWRSERKALVPSTARSRAAPPADIGSLYYDASARCWRPSGCCSEIMR